MNPKILNPNYISTILEFIKKIRIEEIRAYKFYKNLDQQLNKNVSSGKTFKKVFNIVENLNLA